MSSYGNQPEHPYGQQPQAPGQPTGYAGAPSYAHWGKRVGAYLVDQALLLIAYIPAFIAIGIVIQGASEATTTINRTTGVPETTSATPEQQGLILGLMVLSGVLFLAIFIWNICLKQGRTGYSVGKGLMGIRLIKEETGQPIGAGMAFVRQLAHIVDGIPCNIGYLWPLWDAKRQTFADKILSTVVVNQPKG